MIIDNNQFIGSIPKEIGNLSNLEELEIDYNQLSGNIPVELGNLSNLAELNLSYNQLAGNISAEIGNLSKLTMLDLYNNKLNGYIPSTLGNLDKLTFLDLGLNQLVGNIPVELGNLIKLSNLRLAANQLSGDIPSTLGNLSSLKVLKLNSNQLEGNIPIELYQLKTLTDLRLNHNSLNGELKPALGNLCNLSLLSLNNNKFSGNIPPELGNLEGLRILNLNNNQFVDIIPTELSNLSKLYYFNIESNQLSGGISAIIDSLTRLKILHLQKNYFSCTDIENAIEQIRTFTYSPQYNTPLNYDSITINIFDTLSIKQQLTLSPEYIWEDSLDLTYQWKRNGKIILDAILPTYIIDSISVNNVGEYTLHILHENCASNGEVFESISDPIYVFLEGYDLYGQPVAYDQIMVEFDNAEETQKYVDEILENPKYQGELLKECNCNRELYLWKFESTEGAVKALLEIDRKTKSIKKKSNIKGDFNNLLSIGETENTQKAYQIFTDSLLQNMNYTDNVLVFILDTGLDEESFNTTPYTLSNAPLDDCYGIEKNLGYSYVDSTGTSTPVTTNYQDEHWHGTYGFHAISGNQTENNPIKIVPLKIFDKDGTGNLFNLTCALYHAIDKNADVVNISAGYQGQPSGILESAINYAREKGIFITTAAGNDSLNIDSLPQYPAYYAGQYHKFVTGYNALGNAKFERKRILINCMLLIYTYTN